MGNFSKLTHSLPGLEPSFMGAPIGGLPVELTKNRLFIDDSDRIPDVILERDNIKYLCWYNYREKDAPFCWRIAKLFTGSIVDTWKSNDDAGLIEDFTDGSADFTPSDDIVYQGNIITYPYGVDSYNFDINKINEYPFVMRGTRW